MKPLLAVCSLAVSAVPCLAQAVLLVGPGGLPEIADAIAIASPGDTVLVAPGSYAWFALTKPLTIRAITPGSVVVGTTFFGLWGPTVHQVASAPAVLVGLRMTNAKCWDAWVVLEDCVMDGTQPLDANVASVSLQGCDVRTTASGSLGSRPALTATSSHVVVDDTVFAGWLQGGSAVSLSGSTLHGSHVAVQAANGVALTANAGSTVWLSDSTLTTAATSCPMQATAGHLDRCTLVPNCGGLPAGPLLGVHRPTPLQTGAPFVLDFRAQPAEIVAVFASSTVGTTTVPGIEQPVWLDPIDTWLAFVLSADAQGAATMTWNVPAVPGLVHTTLWFQGLGLANAPMQASPVAGGVVR